MKLANKVALITGAGSGIGRACAMLFASEGARIAVVDIDEQTAAETERLIRNQGGEAIAIRADVGQPEDVQAMVESTVKRFGTVDVLFNNAATEGPICFAAQISLEQFDRVIAVNLRGAWLGMKYVLPLMMEKRSGSIINISSLAGLRATPGGAAYCASKFAVNRNHPSGRDRIRQVQYPGQLYRPGLDRNADGPSAVRRQAAGQQCHGGAAATRGTA